MAIGLLSMLIITGVMSSEGVECPALRGDDGQLYTLIGLHEDLRPGQRVRVEGEPRQISKCMQGQTLSVKSIARLGMTVDPYTATGLRGGAKPKGKQYHPDGVSGRFKKQGPRRY